MCWEQNIFVFLKPAQGWVSKSEIFIAGSDTLICNPDFGWIWYEKKFARPLRGRAYSNPCIMFYLLFVFKEKQSLRLAIIVNKNLAFPVIAITHIIVSRRKISGIRNIKMTINIATTKILKYIYYIPFSEKI